jgi:hypothetical protein
LDKEKVSYITGALKMIKNFIFVLFILIAFQCCKKEDNPSEQLLDAVITGFDARDCACCGGLMINFNNEAKPYTGDFFLITNPPADLGLNENSTFPVYLKVSYVKSSSCVNTHIKILSFMRK